MRAFHATDPANVASIRQHGLRTCLGEVYLSDSEQGAAKWKAMLLKQVAVIEVEVDGRTLESGCDHSPIMQTFFGTGASLVSKKPIPASAIRAVHIYAVHIYAVKPKHKTPETV